LPSIFFWGDLLIALVALEGLLFNFGLLEPVYIISFLDLRISSTYKLEDYDPPI